MDLHKFVESLNTVERAKLFHILKNQSQRITILDWLEANRDLPNRASNPLKFYTNHPDAKIWMDELTVNDLKNLRNLGEVGISLIITRYPLIKQ